MKWLKWRHVAGVQARPSAGLCKSRDQAFNNLELVHLTTLRSGNHWVIGGLCKLIPRDRIQHTSSASFSVLHRVCRASCSVQRHASINAKSKNAIQPSNAVHYPTNPWYLSGDKASFGRRGLGDFIGALSPIPLARGARDCS